MAGDDAVVPDSNEGKAATGAPPANETKKRGPGRPRKNPSSGAAGTGKRRGRPAGSKNKPRSTTPRQVNGPTREGKRERHRPDFLVENEPVATKKKGRVAAKSTSGTRPVGRPRKNKGAPMERPVKNAPVKRGRPPKVARPAPRRGRPPKKSTPAVVPPPLESRLSLESLGGEKVFIKFGGSVFQEGIVKAATKTDGDVLVYAVDFPHGVSLNNVPAKDMMAMVQEWKVAKEFADGWFQGGVVSMKSAGKRTLYMVVYEDEDSEEMEHGEFTMYHDLYVKSVVTREENV